MFLQQTVLEQLNIHMQEEKKSQTQPQTISYLYIKSSSKVIIDQNVPQPITLQRKQKTSDWFKKEFSDTTPKARSIKEKQLTNFIKIKSSCSPS